MRIGAIMMRKPVTIPAGATLAEAAERMAAHGVGGLAVVDDGRLVGMVAAADVVRGVGTAGRSRARAAARGLRSPPLPAGPARRPAVPARCSVASVMAAHPPSVSPATPVAQVAELMLRYGVTQVPVVAWGSVVGMATQSDIVAAATGRRRPSGAPDARFGWRFLQPQRRLPEARGQVAMAGLRLVNNPDRVAFANVPAAYPDILDALAFGLGLTVCRVRLSGFIAAHGSRHVATEWECVWVNGAGVAVAAWAAGAVDRALQLQLAAGRCVDPRIRTALGCIARAGSPAVDAAAISRAVRSARAARREGLALPGVARALDAVVEAAQAALAAHVGQCDVSVWERIATRAAWDAAHQALCAMGPAGAEDQRQALEEAVLGAAPLEAGVW